MRETDEVLIRRQHIQETLEVLEQAHRVLTVSSVLTFLSFLQCFNIYILQTLEEFPLEAEKIEKGYDLADHATGLPKIQRLSEDGPNGIFSSSPTRYGAHQASHMVI